MDSDTIITIAAMPFYTLAVIAASYAAVILMKAGYELFNNESQALATNVQTPPANSK